MTKENIISIVAAEAGVTKRLSGEVIESFLNTVTRALESGEDVKLAGFGTFEIKCRSARTGRNMHTGEQVPIPARKRPAFTPSEQLLKRF